MPGRRSDAEARDTRARILSRAADIASVEGLEGLTIGRLAAGTGLSKAGVLGHFGAKEELQLATLDHAAAIFRAHVWEPARHAPGGLPRLLAICEAWVGYEQDPPFVGGCFFAAVSFEFDTREGRVHDELRRVVGRWRRTLVAEARTAVEAGDLPADTDPEQLAFTLKALASGISPTRYLEGDEAAVTYCLRAMHAALGVDEASLTGRARS